MSDKPAEAGASQAEPVETPERAGAEAVKPSAASASPWDALPDDAKGYVQNKGWKDAGDLLESYRNLEKLRGVPPEKLLRLPDDPKDMGQVYDRLGRPESPDKYTLALPEDQKDTVFAEMAAAAHQAGLSDDQFKGLQAKFGEVAERLQTQRQEQFDGAFEGWKKDNPTDFNNVRFLMGQAGVTPEEMTAAINGDAAAFYGALAKVAGRMGETPAVTGDTQPGFKMTPAQAQAKLDAMMGDEGYQARLYHDDPKVRMAAANEKAPLHAIIADAKGSSGDRLSELEAENMRLKAQMRATG